MKRILISILLCALLQSFFQFTSACAAEQASVNLAISDLIIRKQGSQVDFRVIVGNIGNADAENLMGNLSVALFVFDRSNGKWHELKRWSDIDRIAAGEKVARDYLPVVTKNPQILSGKFTLQAAIELKYAGAVKISKESLERSYPGKNGKNP
ncbi:MAG: hypothetical protein RDV48_24705 [Candidatus Eremiobacteraeota bacterium]|nr:hypothetical protein [Candidatus Eremiobacteraeota bacterium]